MNLIDKTKLWYVEKPDALAMISEEKKLTYKSLWEQSDALAAFIQNKLGKDITPVVVYGHKNPMMLVCFFACLKSGRAYIPVDVSFPTDRVESIIRQSQTKIVLATEPFVHEKSIQINDIEEHIMRYNGTILPKSQWVKDNELFYVLFTSGSTGEPKGVQITSNCISNFLDWALSLGGTDKTGQVFINQAPFSFDLSVYELTMALASGGTIFCLTKKYFKILKI